MGRLRDWIELAALPLLTAAVFVLWDMNKNISQLNIQVGIIISERDSTKETLRDLELRVRELEKTIFKSKEDK